MLWETEQERLALQTEHGVLGDPLSLGYFVGSANTPNQFFGQWSFDHCGWCEFDRICPTSRGEQWVELRKAPELARYRDLADPDEPDDELAEAVE